MPTQQHRRPHWGDKTVIKTVSYPQRTLQTGDNTSPHRTQPIELFMRHNKFDIKVTQYVLYTREQFNIKMPTQQHRRPHWGDKTVIKTVSSPQRAPYRQEYISTSNHNPKLTTQQHWRSYWGDKTVIKTVSPPQRASQTGKNTSLRRTMTPRKLSRGPI